MGQDVSSDGAVDDGPLATPVAAQSAEVTDTTAADGEPPMGWEQPLILTLPVAQDQAVVTAEGAVLQLDELDFVIPPGAVDSETEVAVYEYAADLPSDLGVVTPVYRCEAEGVVFDPPLELTFTLDTMPDEEVGVLWHSGEGETEILPVERNGNQITVQSSHCSNIVGLVISSIDLAIKTKELVDHFEESDESCPDGSYDAGGGYCCPNGQVRYGDMCFLCPAELPIVGPSPDPNMNQWGVACYPDPVSTLADCGTFCRFEVSERARGAVCCPEDFTCPAPGSYECTKVTAACETEGWRPLSRCDDQYCCPAGTDITSCPPTTCSPIDPCKPAGLSVCDPNASCTVTGSSFGDFTCGPCRRGFRGDGISGCTDIDECATNNGGCDALTTCTNTEGGRTCGACPAGYFGDGASGCNDADVCGTNNGGCDALTTCTNTGSGRTCGACPAGYSGDGVMGCVDVDECATNNGGCDSLTTCTNTAGARTCGACPAGYSGDGTAGCVDIDECATNNGGCDPQTNCTNTPGGRNCGGCPAGYTGDGGSGCVDVDECATNNGGCDSLTTCTNTAGGRTCGACPAGFSGDGESGCADVDECAVNNGGCDALTTCTNAPGGRTCGACPAGYSGDGASGCVDVNECATNNGGCDSMTTCTNTPGGRTCGACPAGYSGDGTSGCVDVNECATNNGGCDSMTTCTNTPGGRTCGACPAGYSGDGASGCVDIDECATNNGGCDPVAECTNTPGGRTCGACPSGYTGDGTSGCVDINECATNNGGCDPLTTCTNTPGGRDCGACPAGYYGAGETGCTDIDECAVDNGGCDPLKTCTNTPAGRVCGACPNGMTDDGTGGCTVVESTRVFVTSAAYNGNLGGTAGANAKCQSAADAQGLGGTWDAWISDTTGHSPATKFAHADHPYMLLDGTMIALNWADLTDGSLRAPIDVQENGVSSGTSVVFTGTGIDGALYTSGSTLCNNWTSPFGAAQNTYFANGVTDSTGGYWTARGTDWCDSNGRLFCFEGCPDGYVGDGSNGCVDVDECATNNGGCDALTACTNTDGGRTCGACPAGYSGDGETGCMDIDECATDNGGCVDFRTCTNTVGSRTCGPCPNGTVDDGAGGCTVVQSQRVFVTSAQYNGNLGGTAGADTKCQSAADAQGLGGTWSAWISDTTGHSPASTFVQANHPYVLLDGTIIALNWADLTDGELRSPINIQENGASSGYGIAFTGTGVDGALYTSGSTLCNNWTNPFGASQNMYFVNGVTDATMGYWTARGTDWCDSSGRLFCFED